MSREGYSKFRWFMEEWLGLPLENYRPIPISGRRLIIILWPLNEVFRPMYKTLKVLRYDPLHEAEADLAVVSYAQKPVPETWTTLHAGVLRVLLERHFQMIHVALLNEIAGNAALTYLPEGLPQEAELGGAMISFLYRMELPFPAGSLFPPVLPDEPPTEPFAQP